ncbi:MAG: hypothetical protein GY807_00015 [Gammaproteobacteria bacterium]|nr:hypothetical protein [Gammaproteobacteria bacterium]
MAIVNGIDVSHHQGNIAFNRVTQDPRNFKFCFVKATEGFDFKDPRFKRNWQKSREVGYLRGAYHFFLNKGGKRQAENFLLRVNHRHGDLQPALDLEVSITRQQRGRFVERARKFVDVIEAELGRKPFIYTTRGFWDMYGNPDFSDCPLWVANFTTRPTPKLPRSNWSSYSIWQYSERGRVPGIGTNLVDLNRFNGRVNQLKRFQLD